MGAAALWLALSAGLAWCILIPALCWAARVRWVPCIDACLVTMAWGEAVLTFGAVGNALLWKCGALGNAASINMAVVAISYVVMGTVLARRLGPHGVSTRRAWVLWMLALNGSGGTFFLLFYQWLHGR
jgi:hypothetical protein